MGSVLDNSFIFSFGNAVVPNNFMLFDESKKKLWFKLLKKQVEEDNQEEFNGISISKEKALQIDDKFIKLFQTYFPNKALIVDVTGSGLFNREEFVKMAELRDKLDVKNKLMFGENFTNYSFENVCNANSKINSWADEINNLKINGKELSPLEKYYVAYNYVTRFNYNESKDNFFDSRNLIQVLNGNNIVCVGYAQLLSALCARLGIECNVQSVGYDSTEINHMNCQVTIKDEKYGVDGTFYSDPCFDSVIHGNTAITYALISYNDIPKIFRFHHVKFDDKDYINFNNDISKSNETVEEIKKKLCDFLYSQKEHFSNYIDKSICKMNDKFTNIPANKKDKQKIIDNIIDNCLIKVDYGKKKSDYNIFQSDLLDLINMENLASMILKHTKKNKIDKFKEELFEEMKTYLPEYDSYTFNKLADAYVRYNLDIKERETEERKKNAKNLTFDCFEKLISNLKEVKGESEAFDPKKVDKLILSSTVRARNDWGEFRNASNVFSLLSDIYSILYRNYDLNRIQTGEQLLKLGEEVFNRNKKNKNESNKNEKEDENNANQRI